MFGWFSFVCVFISLVQAPTHQCALHYSALAGRMEPMNANRMLDTRELTMGDVSSPPTEFSILFLQLTITRSFLKL